MKKLQVFETTDMPNELSRWVQAEYEMGQNTFIKWYPTTINEFEDPTLPNKINEWMLENGMEINDHYLFHVLILSWW